MSDESLVVTCKNCGAKMERYYICHNCSKEDGVPSWTHITPGKKSVDEANLRVTMTMIHALVVRELSEPIDPKDNGGILIMIATLCENAGCISKVMDDAYLCECGRMDHGEAAANAHHAETGHCNWRMKK